MKKLLSIALISVLGLFLWSCSDDSNSPEAKYLEMISSQATVTGYTTDHLQTSCIIKNISDSDVKYKMSMEIVSLTTGHAVSPCFGGTCFSPVTENTAYDNILTLAAGDSASTKDFVAYLEGGDIAGTSVVKFIFTPVEGTDNTPVSDAVISYTCTFSTEVIVPVLEFVSKIEAANNFTDNATTAVIKNISDKAVQFKLYITVEDLAAGHSLFPCFGGTCLPPVTESMELAQIVTLAPGTLSNDIDFICHLDAGGNAGETTVKYTFYPLDENGKKLEHLAIEYTCIFTAM